MSNRIYHRPVKRIEVNWLLAGLIQRAPYKPEPKLPKTERGINGFFNRVLKWTGK